MKKSMLMRGARWMALTVVPALILAHVATSGRAQGGGGPCPGQVDEELNPLSICTTPNCVETDKPCEGRVSDYVVYCCKEVGLRCKQYARKYVCCNGKWLPYCEKIAGDMTVCGGDGHCY